MHFLRQHGWVILALLFFGAMAVSAEEEDLTRKFSFENAKTPPTAAMSERARPVSTESELAKLEFDDRRAQEKFKLYERLILSVVMVCSLGIVLKFITKARYSADNIVIVSGLVFIVFGTIFLVIMSKAETQLTASMGILGAIAGYLFGTLKKEEIGKEERIVERGKAPA
jgi:hypothetical protein